MIIKKRYIKMVFITVAVAILICGVIGFNNNFLKAKEASTKPSIKLPIIMYHQILKDSKTWGKYIISPDDFEKDLIYLIEKGYTTVDMQDLIDFTYNNKELPSKPIMITFDDGYLTSQVYILPILKKYNAKAVVSIVGEFTDKFTEDKDTRLSYAHLSWDDVRELVKSENIEIQNHSYGMHKISKRKGISKIKGESLDNYRKALNNDILNLQSLFEKNTGYIPTTFTYPFGTVSKDAEPILKDMGFLATLTCNEGVNILTGDKEELYNLKRYNRPYNIDREKFFSKFE